MSSDRILARIRTFWTHPVPARPLRARTDPSADPGAKIGVGIELHRPVPLPSHALRDWHERDKPSRPEAVTHRQDAIQLANAQRSEFQFTVNQDTRTIPLQIGEIELPAPRRPVPSCECLAQDRNCAKDGLRIGRIARATRRPTVESTPR